MQLIQKALSIPRNGATFKSILFLEHAILRRTVTYRLFVSLYGPDSEAQRQKNCGRRLSYIYIYIYLQRISHPLQLYGREIFGRDIFDRMTGSNACLQSGPTTGPWLINHQVKT